MTDRGWAVHDLTETEALVSQAYVDGLRAGQKLQSVKNDSEVEELEDRLDAVEEQFESAFGVSLDD